MCSTHNFPVCNLGIDKMFFFSLKKNVHQSALKTYTILYAVVMGLPTQVTVVWKLKNAKRILI